MHSIMSSNLESVSKAARIVLFENFQAFGLPQMQSVELLVFGVPSNERPVNVLDAILVQVHVKQCSRSAILSQKFNFYTK